MTLELDAPNSTEPPLSVWQVGYGPDHPQPLGPTATYVQQVSVRFTAPNTRVIRGTTLSLTGPGTITPTSNTSFDELWPGQSVTVTWRWTAPVRNQSPPYSLTLAARAEFSSSGNDYTERNETEVDVRPPAPPTEDSYVSDVPLSYEVNGFGPIKRDTWNGGTGPATMTQTNDGIAPNDGDGELIELDGVTYDKGLGTHSPSVAGFYLGGNCTMFTSTIGFDDRSKTQDTATFGVIGDEKVLYECDGLIESSPAQSISVAVEGVQTLELVVETTDDGRGHSAVDWADAHLTCRG